MSDASRRRARRLGRSIVVGLGLACAAPALAYAAGRPWVGRRKGWIELADDFAPWLHLPAPVAAVAGVAAGSPSLTGAGVALCGAFAARWGRRFSRCASVRGPSDLTVMTFNTLAWHRDATEIVRAIECAEPDLVTLQEIGPRPIAQIFLALERRLPYVALHATPSSSGTATLSRFPLLEAEPFTLSGTGAHWCQRVVVAAPGGPLTLLNVHTKIPRLRRSRVVCGRLAVPTSFSAARRLAEVRHLCELIDATAGPLLAMGDFNMTERSEDHALIARRLTDAYRVAGRGLGHTFPAWLKFPAGLPLPFPALRLDHVFHSEHFRTLSARVGPSAGSDHHAVIARLARRVGPDAAAPAR